MTDSQSPRPAKKTAPSRQRPVSASRMRLAERFGVDTVDDIAAVAREEAYSVVREMFPEIRQLVQQQLDVKQRAEELPPADQAAVAPQVNDASRQTREVAKDANDMNARQQAGEKVDPQELTALEERATQARESSDQAREAVDRKAAAAAQARQEHEAQQTSRSKQPVSTPAPSRDDAEQGNGNYVTQTQLTAALDQVYAHVSGVDATATRAIAIAKASAKSVAPLRRAASWAMIAFVAVGVLYLLITGLTPIEHVWRHNIVWAFGASFIAWCVGVITAKEASANAESNSEAHTGRQDDEGIDIVRQRDDEHTHHPADERASAR